MARTTGLNATLGANGWAVPQLMDLTGHAAEHAAMGSGVSIKSYGAKCDGVAVYDATATNSTTSTVASASLVMTSADIGKRCAVVPYVDSSLTTRTGTITAVAADGLSCTCSLSSAPGALTGATFIYGTDDTTAINNALAAAKSAASGLVVIPAGIAIATSAITVPCGVTLAGVGNYPTGGKAKDMRYAGSSLILAATIAGPFVVGGDIAVDSPKGWAISRLNIDCLDLAYYAYQGSTTGRTEHIDHCTFNRGITGTVTTSATSRMFMCCFFNQHRGNVVTLGGDASFLYNIVTGAGNGFYGVKLSNTDDCLVLGNHIWKDGGLSSMLGGSIFVSWNTASTVTGGVTIEGNKFDTAYGPHIYLKASGASTGRGCNIIGNQAMNNDAVTNGTGAFIELEIASGCVLRGLNIHGNIVRGSWNDPSKGQHTYFLNASATAGNVYASSVTGNIIDNVVTGGYGTFTPGYSAGNFYIVGTGTTPVAF